MRRAPLVLAATSLAAFTATLDNTVVAVALRDVQQDLSAGVAALQGVVTAYTVALAALLLVGGALVDVLGARRVLLTGLVVFAAASGACALAPSVGLLLAARVVQGAGASLLLPGGLAVLAGAYPDPTRRARAVGTWAATGGLALVAGPVLGGLLVAAEGWRAVFWVNVPLCVLVAALLLLALHGEEPPVPTSGRVDVPGAVGAAVTLGSLTSAVVVLGRSGVTVAAVLLLATALVSAVVLAVVERRADDPLLPVALLRERAFSASAAGALAASLAVFVLLVFLSLFLQLVQSHPALGAGTLLLPLPAALVVTAPLTGRWRGSPAVPVGAGLALAAAGLLVLGQVLERDTSGVELGLLLAVVGAGVGLTTAPVVTAALAVAGPARAGLAAASTNVARELGGVVAVAGLGALALRRLSYGLGDALAKGGVPGPARPQIIDALLSGRTSDADPLLVRAAGLDKALKLGATLADSARASFVTSTRLVLDGAGIVLLVVAVVAALGLRTTRTS